MPKTFDDFGVQFLYPENWVVANRDEEEGDEGVTFDLPSGGFFSIEQNYDAAAAEVVFNQVAEAIGAEFGEVERESVHVPEADESESAMDLRFYCLDLIVVSRIVLLTAAGRRLVVQFQAEMSDFEANEPVLQAILVQLRRCAA